MRLPIRRSESGSSIAIVLGMSVVLGLWVMGLVGLVVPAYEKAAQGRLQNVLRSAAEAGLDWMNNNLVNETASMAAGKLITNAAYDDAANDGYGTANGTVTDVTSKLTGLPAGVKVTVCVNNVAPPDNAKGGTLQPAGEPASIIYDPSIAAPANANANQWRMITATAKSGTITKRITVICKPAKKANPFFQSAMSAKNNVTLSGGSIVQSVDTSNPGMAPQNYDGTVTAIGSVTFNGANTKIGGDVVVYSPNGLTSGSGTVGAGNGSTVYGNIQSYGGIDSSWNSSNVLGNYPNPPWSDPNYALNKINPQYLLDLNAPTYPPAPTAPPTATSLGDLKITGGTYTLPPAGATPNAQGQYDINISSLSITGKGSLNITAPVNLYVQGTGASIYIGGNGINNVSGVSSNLRVWYSGSSTVTVAGNGNFTGVIYAPNTTVKNTGGGTITGSVVGNYVNESGTGNFYYDRALLTNPITIPTWFGFQTVSWREPSPTDPY